MNFIEIIKTFLEPTLLKIVTSILVAMSFLFGEVYEAGIIAVIMLMIFDTIFGVAASYYEGKAITSRRFSRAVQKGIVYLMAISSGYFMDNTIPVDFVQATMIGFIAVTEFISILENMGRMGYQTPKKLLNQLKEFQSSK